MLLCEIAEQLFETGHVKVPLIMDQKGALSSEIKQYILDEKASSALDEILLAAYERQTEDWAYTKQLTHGAMSDGYAGTGDLPGCGLPSHDLPSHDLFGCDLPAAREAFLWVARVMTALANRELSEPLLASWVQGASQQPAILMAPMGTIGQAKRAALNHQNVHVHLSVDLSFKFLGSVDDMCAAVASLDPIRKYLLQMLVRWPLSSIGANYLDALAKTQSVNVKTPEEALIEKKENDEKKDGAKDETLPEVSVDPSDQKVRLESLEILFAHPITRQLIIDRLYEAAEAGRKRFYLSDATQPLCASVAAQLKALIHQAGDAYEMMYPQIDTFEGILSSHSSLSSLPSIEKNSQQALLEQDES